MKALARSYIWWIGLDKDIESLGKSCESCQAIKSNPTAAPLHPWVWPDTPWTRIHVDYAGPFLGKMFFLVVDAHSKWPEVFIMKSTTSQSTIEALRSLFGRYGLPEQLVSDNGPQFTSGEFLHFMRSNRIKHIRSPTYHPASNGQVERFVQTMKRSLKASERDSRSLSHRLAEFLLSYRSTPHATTNCSPSNLFLKRQVRTKFDLLRRTTKGFVETKQAEQKGSHDQRVKLRDFFPGSLVNVRNYLGDAKWIPGIILRKLGPLTYSVDVGGNRTVKRHIDQLRQRMESTEVSSQPVSQSPTTDDFYYPYDQDVPAPPPARPPHDPCPRIPRQVEEEPRYPQRQHRPPDRFIHQY